MCVICAKPAGVEFPTVDYVYDMWCTNPDGAGFMWAEDGKVHIRKGFMKFNDFKEAYQKTFLDRKDSKNMSAVMHFRITTHGGTKPENCHPFPVSGNMGLLQKLECTTNLGAAHNGIITGVKPRKNCSDTMEYIVSCVSVMKKINKRFYLDKNFNRLIESTIDGSRFCFLDPAGTITTIGDWHSDDGLLLSNKNFKWRSTWNSKTWGGYNYGWYDEYEDELDAYYNERYGSVFSKDNKTTVWNSGSSTSTPKFLPERAGGEVPEEGWVYRNVMDLCFTDDAVVYLDGVAYEPYEFYMDHDGVIYSYTEYYDALYRIPGAYAKNKKDNQPPTFDYEHSDYFWTLPDSYFGE